MIKKLLYSLLLASLFVPNMTLSTIKLATLIDSYGDKAIVEVGSQGAQYYFGKGYTLYTKPVLGSFAPSTGFTTKLLSSITSTVTTIYVSSVKDINGVTLPCSTTNKCYFNIEPGTSRQEPIVCTTAGTNYFSGCTRGLAASGSSEAAVTAYQLPHNAGSTIIMTNIAQFYGNFVDVTTTQNIGGLKTFTATTTFSGLPNTTSTYTPTADGDLATKKFVSDSIAAGGVPATTGTAGLSKISTKAQAAAGTTGDGTYSYALPSSMATSTSQVATTSIPVTNTSGKLDTSFIDQTANYSWTGTNSFATSTMATSTITSNTVASSTMTLGQILTWPTASTSVVSKGYTDYVVINNPTGIASSSVLQQSADTERNTNTNSYAKIKEIKINLSGTVGVAFDLHDSGDMAGAYGRVYINGVAVGTQQTTTSGTYISYFESVNVNAADLVQLYYRSSSTGDNAYIRNFRLYYTKGLLTETIVNTN
jgi:hypothetical protein